MRRIAVLGAGGAGKTVLANRLGDLLGIDVVHLDALRYDQHWQLDHRAAAYLRGEPPMAHK